MITSHAARWAALPVGKILASSRRGRMRVVPSCSSRPSIQRTPVEAARRHLYDEAHGSLRDSRMARRLS